MSTTTNPLPILVFHPQPWMDAAACNGEDPDLFFPDAGDSGRRGKAVCARCHVRLRCLDYALAAHVGPNGGSSARNTDHGVWGGTTAVERDRIRRRRAG